MLISRDSLTSLAGRGYKTLQIPEFEVTIQGDHAYMHAPVDTIEIPDSWVCHISGDAPCLGKQQGFLYFTRAGYEANKPSLRAAFEHGIATIGCRSDNPDEWTWAAFEAYADAHFAKIEQRRAKLILNLQSKIHDAEQFQV